MGKYSSECMVIYRCLNIVNGKSYIGKTTDFKKRKKDHIRNAIKGYLDYPFYRAINKYGVDSFEWSILCSEESNDKLNEKEIFYIAEYNSHSNKNGYNVSLGGDGNLGYKHTDEFKRKQSERNVGNKYSVGRKLSNEHKLKLSIALKGISRPQCGKAKTDEQKKHLSNVFMGRVFSETHKAKLAKANRESHNKNIYSFKNIEGEIFTGAMLEFKEKFNLDRSSITKLVNGKIKTMKGWSLVEYNW
jgi:group I intron endonuclease